ncbi:MAG: GH116 family glycosyl hydrolase [Bacteroidota bacterium]|nr:GH116 family glycosyl hydrolase [Bacteroidota bacterium]MDP4213988.1 GH116 family glycosyl hydrolase [Bacteroidota bacterium]MDP4249643.1 GH116 family glycosyl hydrolase [Bacteroidota bacterium]
MERRSFLKKSGLLTAGVGLKNLVTIAGPFAAEEFARGLAPQNKRLDAAWVKSLYERGTVTAYRKSKNELNFIGMPVGGICCGTVYVGGDGRLWVWDIFNQNPLGVVNKVLPYKLDTFNVSEINNVFGTLYLEPATQTSPLQQGFALLIKHRGVSTVKRLHHDDWQEIIFEATYPAATVRYIDYTSPVEVTLHAFSPFIPGNEEDSGLPATTQTISIKNTSDDPIEVELVGWLDNRMLLYTEKEKKNFRRVNKSFSSDSGKGIILDVVPEDGVLKKAADYGNMVFMALSPSASITEDWSASPDAAVRELKNRIRFDANAPVAMISTSHKLKPKQESACSYIFSWYTPNISFDEKGSGMTVEGADFHYYSKRFADAREVAEYIGRNHQKLSAATLLWKETWYDSTLPWWFLERTFLNISCLATTSSHRFQSGRFYAWEGVGCCHGTCTHVYQYAHAMSRIFPGLERDERERVDLGIGYDEATGMIRIRGEKTGPSIDGQAGTVLRIYREYLMSADGKILKDYWPRIRKAVEFVMAQDKNKDGMEDTPMENTLDALWSGEISWIVGLCIAAVYAGQKMAEEMQDAAFAETCKNYVEKGRKNMEELLFNGEYFIHRPDPAIGKKEIGSYNTCHIDQVYGQSWAWQVGLGRVLDKEKTMSALKALWKYNFMPDVGPYIKVHKGGRFYALAGEGGMVMNTNPKNEDHPYGEAKAWQIGYFSECMSGFEHQVASHMMAEGMMDESLVLTKTIHDRYHARKRNPFNEIECSDHYGRAMASYGTFLSACGFDYNGPKGYLRFAPKWNADHFKAPFTAAEGWGSYSQKKTTNGQQHTVQVKEGALSLQTLVIDKIISQPIGQLSVELAKQKIPVHFTLDENQVKIEFESAVRIQKGEELLVIIQS